MKYVGMPLGMWLLFRKSFRGNLVNVLGLSNEEAKRITKAAKPEYKRIIESLPTFEKGDRFMMNIVNCAMFSAFYLQLSEKPDIEMLIKYYDKSMMIAPMRWFCRMSGKNKFSEKDIRGLMATAALNAADRNPYSWNMEFLPYADGSGYEARFTKCGICTLMKELGIFEAVPAMCRLDYAMSEAGGASEFVREYTLASGGPYCDCGYKKK
ncbi:MAG: L-2-amino-thiazoline-4-carboxylic acid hydrolase [Lachnospiraceae bacterium]|nr:L-2-amino-thiazoline-4-carboxylic acid hydrolase [Lachnospiraceae bacterium]